MNRTVGFLITYYKILITLLTPFVCLPIFLVHDTKATRCMYSFALMVIYWITESIPPALTSLTTMVLFPLLGVLNSDKVAKNFMNDTNMMLLGSIAIAIAMENTGLHVRIALYVIKCIGCSCKKLHIGLCMVTMFISMWIANTAATALMIPIVEGTLVALQTQGLIKMFKEDPTKPPEDWRPSNITKCYYISAAYCSTIGGSGCIIGSGANLAFKGLYEVMFPDSPGVEFSKWMMHNTPLMLVNNIAMILWLQILFLGLFRPFSKTAKELSAGDEAIAATKQVINNKIDELGPLKFGEIAVAIIFVGSIILWFFRRPGFMPGWPEYISDVKCGDAVVAIVAFTLFFLVPIEPSFVWFFGNDESKVPDEASKGILTWKYFNAKMHWNMIFVLGGGFAMADAAKESGMTSLIADYLQDYMSSSAFLNLVVFCSIGTFMTQFLSSNVACITIMVPIILEACSMAEIHPMYLGFSNAVACSFAYFLPVSTPPNALVAGPARMNGADMMVAGLGAIAISLTLLVFIFPVYAPLVWDFNFPEWAAIKNVTEPEF
ncbi:unnamed protein product [Phyllotreta striolata]|uniref:Protein I'm not dead yet n=1 Tax=Phyllotreta striolata TaxID=444603 RepID=A0A9N9TSV7_PHYSR|nr:unnamed protein product [Phyllotreta striolata]